MKIYPNEIWYLATEKATGKEVCMKKECYENGVGVKEKFDIKSDITKNPKTQNDFFLYGYSEI